MSDSWGTCSRRILYVRIGCSWVFRLCDFPFCQYYCVILDFILRVSEVHILSLVQKWHVWSENCNNTRSAKTFQKNLTEIKVLTRDRALKKWWRHRSLHSGDVVRSTKCPAVKRPVQNESSLCFLQLDSAVSCTPVFRICIIITEHHVVLSINQLFSVVFCLVCRLMSPHCNAWWQEHAHRHGHPNVMSDLSTNLISQNETSRRTACPLSLSRTDAAVLNLHCRTATGQLVTLY